MLEAGGSGAEWGVPGPAPGRAWLSRRPAQCCRVEWRALEDTGALVWDTGLGGDRNLGGDAGLGGDRDSVLGSLFRRSYWEV